MSSSSSRRKIPPTVIIPPAVQTQDTEAPPLHKPFICNDCEKAFATSGHLTRHQRVHSGEMNYACSFPGCTTRCSRKDNLRQHYRLHFDIRDPEELQRLAPDKRRRKTRVARVATVDVSAASSSTHPQLAADMSDDSGPSRNHTPTPTHHSPSPSSSSNESASSSPYEQYPQERLRALPQQHAWTSSSPNLPQHPPRSGSVSSEGSFPSPYEPPYPQHAYGHLPSYEQAMPPPVDILGNAPAFSRPRHAAAYPPMSSGRRSSQPTLTHAPTPPHHSPSASSSSGESSFSSSSERYSQEPFRALSPGHAQSAWPPRSSLSQETSFRSSYAQPYVQVAYPHPQRPPQAQSGSPPAAILDAAQPFSRPGHSAAYVQSHEPSAMPYQPPWTYDRSG